MTPREELVTSIKFFPTGPDGFPERGRRLPSERHRARREAGQPPLRIDAAFFLANASKGG
jgi:hypothetical protein